jgi:hypothetical protein
LYPRNVFAVPSIIHGATIPGPVTPATTNAVAGAVAAADNVNVLPSTIVAIVVFAGIPVPDTNLPAANPVVEIPVTVVLPCATVAARDSAAFVAPPNPPIDTAPPLKISLS